MTTDRLPIIIDLTDTTLQAEVGSTQFLLRELSAELDKLMIAEARRDAALEMLDTGRDR